MSKMKVIKIFFGSVISLFFLALLAILIRLYFFPDIEKFTFVNKSNQVIRRASVNVCGQYFEYKDMQPEQGTSGNFKVSCEGHYTIDVELRSGKKMHKEVGYVTSGMNFKDEITVTSSDVHITSGPSK